MASSKTYKEYILEQLSLLGGITCRPMMGEFLLYYNGILFGGIYDDCLLLKEVPGNRGYNMVDVIPYPGAKPMFLVEDTDNRELLYELVTVTAKDLFNKVK